jgi:hypothetical protein
MYVCAGYFQGSMLGDKMGGGGGLGTSKRQEEE